MKKQISISVILIVFAFVVEAREYFVNTKGNDDNPGTKILPFASIFKASEIALPGDTITIGSGEYKLHKQFRAFRSGNPDEWILYRGVPGESVVFDGPLIKKVFQNGDSLQFSKLTQGIFQIENTSYLRFENIEVRNSDAAGFIVRGPECKKIELVNCKSNHSHNSGIGLWYCHSVLVKNCEITKANDNDDRYFEPGQKKGREAPHEALSICSARHFEVCNNHIHHCFKEGWDYKMGFTFKPEEIKQALKERNLIAEENLFECAKNRPSRTGQFDVYAYEYLPAGNQMGAPLYRDELNFDFVPEKIPKVKTTGRKWKYAPSP
jgi:hypothetical protein